MVVMMWWWWWWCWWWWWWSYWWCWCWWWWWWWWCDDVMMMVIVKMMMMMIMMMTVLMCLLYLSAEAALGRHAAGTRQRSAGVWSAVLWSRVALSETRCLRAQRDQIQSVRRHQHWADLALQEWTGEVFVFCSALHTLSSHFGSFLRSCDTSPSTQSQFLFTVLSGYVAETLKTSSCVDQFFDQMILYFI